MDFMTFDAEAAGRKLRDLRGDKPLHEVAGAIGVSTMTMSQYERGQRTPRDGVKVALANYYGTTVEQIFFTP